MKVKEYAEQQGVTYQAVYQMLKRKAAKKELEGHITEVNGIVELDDFAVEWLTRKRSEKVQNIIVTSADNRISALEAENKALKDKLILLQDELLKAKEEPKGLLERAIRAETKLELLEQKEKDSAEAEPVKVPWWQRLFT